MIETIGLRKSYGARVAVDGLNLKIERGEIYGFLGPNGAGKTTTLMMILGITRPTAGAVKLFGELASSDRMDLRRRVGVVPEKHPRGTWGAMTSVEYLELFAGLFGLKRARRSIDALLERVGLEDARNKQVRALSQGMLQKLSIVRAILPEPDLLVLDEPINGLDPLGVRHVRDLIVAESREGRTIIISSHLLSEIERVCRTVGIMFRGKLVAEGTMSELLQRIAAEREIEVELETIPAELPARLSADLPFVLGSCVEGRTLHVTVSKTGDHRRELSEYLYHAGYVPVKFVETSPSLEDAFVTITRENIELFASGEAS